MRLILHAGTHKTGTKSIQRALCANAAWLRERGLLYPDETTSTMKWRHHQFAHGMTGVDVDKHNWAIGFVDEIHRTAGDCHTALISSEPIYRHINGYDGWRYFAKPDYWDRRAAYHEQMAKALSTFDVEVVLFLRAPETFAVSLYSEVVKSWKYEESFTTFLAEFAPLFDYDRQIDAFLAAYRAVRVFDYDSASKDGGLVRAFFAAIGFEQPPGSGDIYVNKTNGLIPTWRNYEQRDTFVARHLGSKSKCETTPPA